MKTQISRDIFDPEKRYSGVYQQQGRMITDADWNAMSDIDRERLREALAAVVASGVPRGQPGEPALSLGGLRVNADRTLTPGVVFAGGVEGRLPGTGPIAYNKQPDYPSAPALPAGACVVYADVWDRSVTGNEDETLVDPGLHGADTCTRTQRMVQVKWCPAAIDPEDPAQNPPIGTARLAVKLRSVVASEDPCDPCASQVNVDERVGNYVLRVEVHDVYRRGGDTFVVLKWSRDNGAEQFPLDSMPPGFTQGDWIYEIFDDITEKNLGVNLASSPVPHGELIKTRPEPSAPRKVRTYARQWDGYCVLNITTPKLEEGKDKGQQLRTTGDDQAHGHVEIAGATLRVNLDLVELELEFHKNIFVAGDYWQAVVREATASSGDYVLGAEGAGELPRGVRHRYVKLARFNNTGALVAPSDAERRRLAFPPLTDIRAADVGFTDSCSHLFGGAENVQQALDALCGIAAEDIAYSPPACAPSVASLLQALLGAKWPDTDEDGRTTVKDMLDALLCKLDAARLPYEVPDCGTAADPTVRSLWAPPLAPGPATVGAILDGLLCGLKATHIPIDKTDMCSDLSQPDVVTVNDALKVLCERPSGGGGGCSASVGAGGTYATLDAAIKELGAGTAGRDMVLCLLPGDHPLSDTSVSGKRTIKITGAGSKASTITFSGSELSFSAEEIKLEDLAVVVSKGTGTISLQAEKVSVIGCELSRSGATSAASPVVSIVDPAAPGTSLFFQNNHMTAKWTAYKPGLDDTTFHLEELEGTTAGPAMKELLGAVKKGKGVSRAAGVAARRLLKLPVEDRLAWVKKVLAASGAQAGAAPGAPGPIGKDPNVKKAIAILEDPKGSSVPGVTRGLTAIFQGSFTTGVTVALSLASVDVGGTLADNTIEGEVRAHSSPASTVDVTIIQDTGAGEIVDPGSARLSLQNNQMTRFSSRVDASVVQGTNLETPPAAYARLTVVHNTFDDNESGFVGGFVELSGNRFEAEGKDVTSATVIANALIAVSNSAPKEQGTIITHTVKGTGTANLITVTNMS